ncbi:hypothetical protein Q5752_003819 [Cryptotrichosporon argae]
MATFTLRWGIISTGAIAGRFTSDLLVDPSTRGVADVAHAVAAVGSRSVASARAFLDRLAEGAQGEAAQWGVDRGFLKDTKAYGSYDEVFADADVDAVYIGTPHTYHFANAKAALLAGKHVLCEKPFVLDVAELDELAALAKDKNVFLMESVGAVRLDPTDHVSITRRFKEEIPAGRIPAGSPNNPPDRDRAAHEPSAQGPALTPRAVWTRFHPIAYAVQDIIHSGKLGKVKRFAADFSMDFDPDNKPDSNRMVDPALGGGSLLDMGPYPSVWAMLVLHQHPANTDRAPRVVASHQTLYARSGVDANSRWLVQWDGLAQAQLMTDMTTWGAKESTVVVSCEEADLVIEYPPYRPQAFSIVPHAAPADGGAATSVVAKERFEHPVHAGGGMHYEADEVARCVRDGRTESARMPLEESRIVQAWLDHVRTHGPTVLAAQKGNAAK